MASRWIRRLSIALGALLLLVVVAGALLVATFDAERYKGVAIDWMRLEHQRSLAIDGPIGLSMFPRVEIKLAKLRLSERARADEFASIDEAALALELTPLLRKQLVIDRVQARGVRLALTRDAKGVRNTDDFTAGAAAPATAPAAPPAAGAPALQFDVSGIKLEDVRVTLRDEVANLAGSARLESLVTGRLGNRAESPVTIDASLDFTQPKLKGKLAGKTTLGVDLGAGSLRLSDLDLGWKGDAFDVQAIDATLRGALSWDGKAASARDLSLLVGAALGELKLAGSRIDVKAFRYDPAQQQLQVEALKIALAGSHGADPLKLSLDWPQLEASAQALKGSALAGSVSLAGANRIDGSFKSGAPAGNFDVLKLPALALEWKGSAGPRALNGRLSTDLTLRPNSKGAALDALTLHADITEPNLQPLAIDARGSANLSDKSAAWTLAGTLNANRFDIAGNAALGGAVPFVKAQAKFDALDLNRLLAPTKPAKAQQGPGPAEEPVSFDALKALNGQFGFSAGAFAFRQYKVADARVDAALDGGVLRVGKLAGRTWGGSIDASGSADAKGNRLAVKLDASGVDVDALLKDVAGKDLLEGRGKVSADLSTAGRSVGELRSRLDGSAALRVHDGAVKGFNLARALRQAKAAVSMQQDAVARAQQAEKTDFSEMSASVRIANGVARSDDLTLKSPFLRVGGAGTFDIGRGRIDYVARASVADTAKGQGGAELAALRGVTVPVRLSGPFEAIDWKIEWTGVAAAALENKLKDKLTERLGIAAPGAASAPQEVVKDKLKDRLKGLLR